MADSLSKTMCGLDDVYFLQYSRSVHYVKISVAVAAVQQPKLQL